MRKEKNVNLENCESYCGAITPKRKENEIMMLVC